MLTECQCEYDTHNMLTNIKYQQIIQRELQLMIPDRKTHYQLPSVIRIKVVKGTKLYIHVHVHVHVYIHV